MGTNPSSLAFILSRIGCPFRLHPSSFILSIMRLRLLYNPAAGRGRAKAHVREAEEILRAGGAAVECEGSASPEDMTRLAAESSRGDYDRVVVCGGDGTLNLAVREFDLERGTLALIPLGSVD